MPAEEVQRVTYTGRFLTRKKQSAHIQGSDSDMPQYNSGGRIGLSSGSSKIMVYDCNSYIFIAGGAYLITNMFF